MQVNIQSIDVEKAGRKHRQWRPLSLPSSPAIATRFYGHFISMLLVGT